VLNLVLALYAPPQDHKAFEAAAIPATFNLER